VHSTEPFSIVIANGGIDRHFHDPEALLTHYHSLVGWVDAVANAGAADVTIIQRFRRDLVLRHHAIEYRFVADDPGTPSRAWFRGERLARAVETIAPDVIHVNGCSFPLLVRTLRRKAPHTTAIVVQDHGGSGIQDQSSGLRNLAWRQFHRFGLRDADGFLFTVRAEATPWIRSRIIGDDQMIYEIPEASADPALRWIGSIEPRRLPGRPALLWVGRLDANKDPLTVLAGLEQAAAALPDIALTLAFGADDLLPEVRSRVASSPWLRSRVHLRGSVERSALPALYQGADLFVLGSHREVASFALIEALSFGVIPVVSDIPPFRALTDDGRIGALFRPGDPQAFARSIERMANMDLSSRRKIVREHFERELSWSAIGARALAIYGAAATSRRGRYQEQETGMRGSHPAT
jgi:glycosyltransferase involved in cell wall biosynthesis